MDDKSLGVFLGLSPVEAEIAIPKLSPESRASYEHMADVLANLNMGVVPDGVIACGGKGVRVHDRA